MTTVSSESNVLALRWPQVMLVLASVVLLQVAVFDQLVLWRDARLDVSLIMVVGIAFVAQPHDAAVLGFVTGMMVDLFQFSPFGLHALVFCVAAWALTLLRVRMLQAGASFRVVQGIGAVVAVTGLTWFVGGIFGQSPPPVSKWLGRLLVSAVMGAVLVDPATRLARWMFRDPIDRGPSEADAP